jgi:hypothetical protein
MDQTEAKKMQKQNSDKFTYWVRCACTGRTRWR